MPKLTTDVLSAALIPRFDGEVRSVMLRVALLSAWHVHAHGYAKEAQANPGSELVAVWDDDVARGRAEAADLGVPFQEDLTELLARDDVDAVICTTATSAHRDVLTAAARAGKHIFTEKVLAATVAECTDIMAAVDAAGVVLVLSLPRLYDASTLAVQQVLAAGTLGEIAVARTRLSHGGAIGAGWLPEHFYDPALCGGGALIDLGCHPMYLTELFLGGLPESLSASFGHLTGRAVEDNAVVTLRYPSGALGVVEAGFATAVSPFSIEIHGSAGSLLFGTPEPRLLVKTAADSAAGWRELPLPERKPTAFAQFVQHVADGTKATANVAAGLDLTRLMEAANRSAAADRPVRLADVVG